MKKILALLLAVLMVVGLFAGCGAEQTVETQAPTQAPDAPPAAPEAPETPEAPEAPEAPADPNVLPRNETLYFAGQQWGTVNSWNIIGTNQNNSMAIAGGAWLPYSDVRDSVHV